MSSIPKITELDYLNTPVEDIVDLWMVADGVPDDRELVTEIVQGLISDLQWRERNG